MFCYTLSLRIIYFLASSPGYWHYPRRLVILHPIRYRWFMIVSPSKFIDAIIYLKQRKVYLLETI